MIAYYVDVNAVRDDDTVWTTLASEAVDEPAGELPTVGETVGIVDADDNVGTASVRAVDADRGAVLLAVLVAPDPEAESWCAHCGVAHFPPRIRRLT